VGLLLAACTGTETAPEPTATQEPTEEIVEPRDYGVPEEDANLENPIPADEASLARGEEIYIASCQKCHGEEGHGDGPSGLRQNPKPVDFLAEHILELSDGELFYIITNGVEGTGMEAQAFFSEDDRWNIVNYIRKLQEPAR
jgi:mono/diheme cytochrome c family protein